VRHCAANTNREGGENRGDIIDDDLPQVSTPKPECAGDEVSARLISLECSVSLAKVSHTVVLSVRKSTIGLYRLRIWLTSVATIHSDSASASSFKPIVYCKVQDSRGALC